MLDTGFPRNGVQSYMQRELNSKLSDNEVYYKNFSISILKNMLCSKLDDRKDLDSMPCSYKINQCQMVKCASWFGRGVQGYLAHKKQLCPRTLQ